MVKLLSIQVNNLLIWIFNKKIARSRRLSIRSLSYGNRKVILHVEKQRYVCPICNKRTTSSIGIVDRNCSISNEVKDEIRKKLSEMKSFTQIGREENTSISTVMRIFHDIEVPHKELDYETVYLDEFRLTNSSDWHKN